MNGVGIKRGILLHMKKGWLSCVHLIPIGGVEMGMRKKRSPFGEKVLDFLEHWGVRYEFERLMQEESDPIAKDLDEYINLFDERETYIPEHFIASAFVWPDETVDFWIMLDDKWREKLDEENA